ncbi:hypothetical protein NUV30_07195 [Kocuria rhizophila]|uniref:Uncharacterized protein n=1 Tax=Kocuria rhizophila TaxID=72000 RepID=A0AAX2SF52_KOCRH|nr:hypothetical protein [Kocuria rhizophila]MCR4526157.1 hypothetical protein [Kocuria rhizophila]TFI02283.1 hypothetical protein E4P33_04380 [Kocuria rhizophila]TFI05412.1 hypothetical protein E4P34_09730 [Kocuria rhizophila]
MSDPVPTLLTVLTAATPAPSPDTTLKPGLDPSQVSPGLVGFLMTFVLTAAVVLLVIDFNRRNRRLRYRAQYAEQRAAQEEQARGAAPAADQAASRDGVPERSVSAGEGPTGARSAHGRPHDVARAHDDDGDARPDTVDGPEQPRS